MNREFHSDIEEDAGRIDEVKERLYGKNFTSRKTSLRPAFGTRDAALPSSWEGRSDEDTPAPRPRKKGFGLRVFFVTSIIFFIVAAGIAGVMLIWGGNGVSSERIEIVVDGPVSVAGGDETDLHIKITNNNRMPILDGNMVISFPSGFHVKDTEGNEITSQFFSIGVLGAGETSEQTLKGRIFGGEDERKHIAIVMEYRVEDSNAIYTKEAGYDIVIDAAPIAVSVDTLQEVNTGQETEVTITVVSNTDTIAEDLVLSVEYPFGFEPKTADPKPFSGTTLWRLGDLPPGAERTVTIRGIVRGQNNDEKTFRAFVGQEDPKNPGVLGVLYNEAETFFVVKDLFLGVGLSLNSEVDDTYTFGPDTVVRGVVTYTNNLSVPLRNVSIEVELDGEAVDTYAVDVRDGYYNPTTSVLVWDRTTYDELASLDAGGSGTLSFSFRTPVLSSGTNVLVKNPSIDVRVNVAGVREGEENVNEERVGAVERTVYVWSDMHLAAHAVYGNGPFKNTGPLPPVAGKETTYTVMMSATNSSNNLSEVTVTGVLPQGVSWKGVIDPLHAAVSYNESTRSVTWRIGRMEAGAGIAGAGPSVAFSIGLVPSTTQIGSVIPLVSDIRMTGYDEYARTQIRQTVRDITTNIVSDPSYTQGWGTVTR
ncbi:MAG: hypothetical protein HGB03_00040 [Candidatus Yonathbacteria bacterium]|nr:hypothetical protein [Candidatus Yonathbacteria bacterium]NTW48070.1 hypothetical protein [Candidatus Yonathbacteria bacterium]